LTSPTSSTCSAPGAGTTPASYLAGEAHELVAGGAELIVLCTNTMHKVADAITEAIDVPFVHIADTTAAAVREAGLSTVGLLATGYTMEQDFYVGRLRDRHRLDVLVPGAPDRALVHRVIYDELCVAVTDEKPPSWAANRASLASIEGLSNDSAPDTLNYGVPIPDSEASPTFPGRRDGASLRQAAAASDRAG
jgi:aspartate racemase